MLCGLPPIIAATSPDVPPALLCACGTPPGTPPSWLLLFPGVLPAVAGFVFIIDKAGAGAENTRRRRRKRTTTRRLEEAAREEERERRVRQEVGGRGDEEEDEERSAVIERLCSGL